MKRDRSLVLPYNLPPRGLSREQAAAYIGVSPTKFDELVKDKRMPGPKTIDGRMAWDRIRLDRAFDALPDRDGHDEEVPVNDVWSKVAV